MGDEKQITVGYLKAYISVLPDDMPVFAAAGSCFSSAVYLKIVESDKWCSGLFVCDEVDNSGNE